MDVEARMTEKEGQDMPFSPFGAEIHIEIAERQSHKLFGKCYTRVKGEKRI